MDFSVPLWLDSTRRGSRLDAWISRYCQQRLGYLRLDGSRLFLPAPSGAFTWLDLERLECRYLAATCSNGSVLVYDTQRVNDDDEGRELENSDYHGSVVGRPGAPRPGSGTRDDVEACVPGLRLQPPVLSLSKSAPGGGHSFSASCASWYPVDSGLLVSGALDGRVKVWDLNAAGVAESFDVGARVWALALSGATAVAAAGCEDGGVCLCDLGSGATLHRLAGHGAPVWAVCWSASNEHQLLSGAANGSVRLWDVRRWGASLAVLDAERTGAPGGAQPARLRANGGPTVHAIAESAVPDPSARDAARAVRAHTGAVTGIVATADGRRWLTAGTDDAVRVWDAEQLTNQLVHFAGAFNRSRRPRRMALAERGAAALFLPSGSAVLGYAVDSGATLAALKGAHYESVNACCWNEGNQELYSAGNDGLLVAWSDRGPEPDE